MGVRLAENNYGDSHVRLLRVTRQENRHDIKELTIGIRFEGDFEAAYTAGDNRKILPADTMKNTVYILAKQYPAEPVEDFALHLVEHFLTYNPQVTRVQIEVAEHPWVRMATGGKEHRWSFTRGGAERRVAIITGAREGITVRSGVEDLIVLKTTEATFEGFLRDPYTTLEEAHDGVLSTAIRATWLYSGDEVAFGPTWHGVRRTLLETFADHESRSLQHTLYAMGESVLKNFDEIAEIHISMPSRQYRRVNLKPFGMENDNEVFQPDDESHDLIEATLKRQ